MQLPSSANASLDITRIYKSVTFLLLTHFVTNIFKCKEPCPVKASILPVNVFSTEQTRFSSFVLAIPRRLVVKEERRWLFEFSAEQNNVILLKAKNNISELLINIFEPSQRMRVILDDYGMGNILPIYI